MNSKVAANSSSPLSTPLHPSRGANFRTHQLVGLSPRQLAFVPTARARIVVRAVWGLGLLATVAGLAVALATSEALGLVGIPVGIGFLVLGIMLDKQANSVGRFFLDLRIAQIGSVNLSLKPALTEVAFSNVEQLQVVKKLVEDGEHDYTSFELNLVTKEGERINIVDHSAGDTLKQEAQQLANSIGCRLSIE